MLTILQVNFLLNSSLIDEVGVVLHSDLLNKNIKQEKAWGLCHLFRHSVQEVLCSDSWICMFSRLNCRIMNCFFVWIILALLGVLSHCIHVWMYAKGNNALLYPMDFELNTKWKIRESKLEPYIHCLHRLELNLLSFQHFLLSPERILQRYCYKGKLKASPRTRHCNLVPRILRFILQKAHANRKKSKLLHPKLTTSL